MPLVIQKYGGSSLATPAHIQRAARRIGEVKASGRDIVVVVSAMGRMTDHLLNLARRTVRHPSQRELDMLVTVGERISMSLLAMSLQEAGVPAISFTGSQSGIITTDEHTEARIVEIRAHRIRDELAKGKAVIIAGFQGVSERKEITTLGRGGSDTTAVALAAALGAECCEILTDVDGLFSADPRLVPGARVLSRCAYDEALELASLGAKMHARSVELAKRFQVRVRIAGSSNPASTGTELSPGDPVQERTQERPMEKTMIRGIATRDGYHLFEATTSLARLLPALKRARVPLRFFTFGKEEVCFLCEKERVPLVQQTLRDLEVPWRETPKIAVVSAIGDGICSSPDVLPDFLSALNDSGAECLLLCSSSLSMTAAVPSSAREGVTRSLHRKLIGVDPAPPAP